MGEEEGMEDLYKVLGFDGGGESCIGVIHLANIFRAGFDRAFEFVPNRHDSLARIHTSKARWAYIVLKNEHHRRKYDARLAETIRIRRLIAQDTIAAASAAVGPAEVARDDDEEERQPSVEDLEQRVADLGIEERPLVDGPPRRWRRRRRSRWDISVGDGDGDGDTIPSETDPIACTMHK